MEEQNPGYDEANRGRVEDAVEGRKEAEQDIAEAEKAADAELAGDGTTPFVNPNDDVDVK